jgi:hypothetical protein
MGIGPGQNQTPAFSTAGWATAKLVYD